MKCQSQAIEVIARMHTQTESTALLDPLLYSQKITGEIIEQKY